MARRIQRKRTKGWKMPANAIYVGRPSPVGNPFRAGVHYDRQHAVDLFQLCVRKFPVDQKDIDRWRDAGGNAALLIGIASGVLVEGLRGKDLACWCGLDEPCHADILLQMANGRTSAVPATASGDAS